MNIFTLIHSSVTSRFGFHTSDFQLISWTFRKILEISPNLSLILNVLPCGKYNFGKLIVIRASQIWILVQTDKFRWIRKLHIYIDTLVFIINNGNKYYVKPMSKLLLMKTVSGLTEVGRTWWAAETVKLLWLRLSDSGAATDSKLLYKSPCHWEENDPISRIFDIVVKLSSKDHCQGQVLL